MISGGFEGNEFYLKILSLIKVIFTKIQKMSIINLVFLVSASIL